MEVKERSYLDAHINSFICGDAIDEMKKFSDGCFDLVVTSPPV